MSEDLGARIFIWETIGTMFFYKFLFKGDVCLKQEFFWILKIWYDAGAGEFDTALLESW